MQEILLAFLSEKRFGMRKKMINFEEELKKFHPSLEVEDAEDAIYNQDMTDMADLLVRMIKESEEKANEVS